MDVIALSEWNFPHMNFIISIARISLKNAIDINNKKSSNIMYSVSFRIMFLVFYFMLAYSLELLSEGFPNSEFLAGWIVPVAILASYLT